MPTQEFGAGSTGKGDWSSARQVRASAAMPVPSMPVGSVPVPIPSLPVFEMIPLAAAPPVNAVPPGAHVGAADASPPVGERRQAWASILMVVVIAMVLGATAVTFLALGRGQLAPAVSPAQTSKTVYAAAMASGSLHYAVSDVTKLGSTTVRESTVADVGRHGGVQSMSGDLGNASVVTTGSAAYLLGNPTWYRSALGLTPAQASSLAGRWISFTPQDSAYTAIVDGTTTASLWGDVGQSPAGPVHQTPIGVTDPSTSHGRTVRSIVYSNHDSTSSPAFAVAGTSRLTFTDGTSLPTTYALEVTGMIDRTPGSEQTVVTFSRWGERVAPVVPQGAVPFDSIATQPPTTA
jgi:hypothetical protein